MKYLAIYILSIVLMMPPPLIHKDKVVYNDVDTHLSSEHHHDDYHHQHDSEQEKQHKHHHHCTVELSVLVVYLPNLFSYEVESFVSKHTYVNYYKSSHTSTFVNQIFQPPRA